MFLFHVLLSKRKDAADCSRLVRLILEGCLDSPPRVAHDVVSALVLSIDAAVDGIVFYSDAREGVGCGVHRNHGCWCASCNTFMHEPHVIPWRKESAFARFAAAIRHAFE